MDWVTSADISHATIFVIHDFLSLALLNSTKDTAPFTLRSIQQISLIGQRLTDDYGTSLHMHQCNLGFLCCTSLHWSLISLPNLEIERCLLFC
ncbi:hypothetical protein L1987_81258 [Smallanthus sonchifolius]|uniref:Uncharacterized protein n=1 Tax=Smallanthus sonchifolius TaxID=185202 RepID=A0ACB8YQD6_9ASTR|nr:hypothetical protein L1987_81258 [Smallanthus sonchifolius]